MALLVPAAFFAAIEQNGGTDASVRPEFLQMSRGIGIILLLVYAPSFRRLSHSLIMSWQICRLSYLLVEPAWRRRDCTGDST